MKNWLKIVFILVLFSCQKETNTKKIENLFSTLQIFENNKIEIDYQDNKISPKLTGEKIKPSDYYLIYQDAFFRDTSNFLIEHYDYNTFPSKTYATKNDYFIGLIDGCDEYVQVLIRQQFNNRRLRMDRIILNQYNELF